MKSTRCEMEFVKRSADFATYCFCWLFLDCSEMDQCGQRPARRAFAGLTPNSFTELSTDSVGIVALGEEEQVAGREPVFAELAQSHLVALFLQKQGPVENQPELHWAAEQVA